MLRSFPVYGSSMKRSISPADEVEHFKRLRERNGYSAFKFRVGRQCGWGTDERSSRIEEFVPLLRKSVGNDMRLCGLPPLSVPGSI